MLADVVQYRSGLHGRNGRETYFIMLRGNVCSVLVVPTMDNLWFYQEELASMQQSSSEKNLETSCTILREMKFKMGASWMSKMSCPSKLKACWNDWRIECMLCFEGRRA
jgi:hypothetical protein